MQRRSQFDMKRMAGRLLLVLVLAANFSGRAQNQPKTMPKADDMRLAGQIYSPAFCPNYPDIVAYERQIEDMQELYFYNYRSGDIQLIRAAGATGAQSDDQFKSLFESADLADYTRFEGQLDWRPLPDNLGRHWFIFVSNGGAKSFDLYLSYIDRFGKLAAELPLRLAHDGVDLYPKWSPDGTSLVFVSGDKSGSDLFLVRGMDNLIKQRNTGLFRPVKITTNPEEDNFPAWSPDSKAIAYQSYMAENGLLNMGINLIYVDEVTGATAAPRSIRLTGELSSYHEYNPSWNARGNYIAYYVSQARVGQTDGNRLVDIGVLAVIPNAATKRIANGRVLAGTSPRLAKNVIPNRNLGPTWGSRCADDVYAGMLFYVKRNEPSFNPITRASLMKWQNKDIDYEGAITIFATRMHRDITATHFKDDKTGKSRFAFASQEQNANRLQVRELPMRGTATLAACIPVFKPPVPDAITGTQPGIRQPRQPSRTTGIVLSTLFPGAGQIYSGQITKGALFATAGAASVASFAFFKSKFKTDNRAFQQTDAIYEVERSSKSETERKFAIAQSNFDQAKKRVNAQKIVAAAAAGIWAINLIDKVILSKPPEGSTRTGFDQPPPVEWPRFSVSHIGSEPILWVSTQIHF